MESETAANIRSNIELIDQTDEAETLVKSLVQMIEKTASCEGIHQRNITR